MSGLNSGLSGAALPRELGITDRPGQVLQQGLNADLPAAWRAAFQPKELTPKERDVLLKKWGLDSGPYAPVFRVLTNPLMIAMLALSHKFPIPRGDNIFKLSQKMTGFASKFPVLRHMSSMQGLFQGMKLRGSATEFVDDFGVIIRDVGDFKSRYGTKYGAVLNAFSAKTGKYPSLMEQRMVSAWLDGLHKPLRGWQGKNGKIRIGSGSTVAVVDEVGTLMPNLESRMSPQLLELAKGFRQTLDDQWLEVFSDVKGRERILKAIAYQKKMGMADDTLDVMSDFLRNPKKIPDYFPRRSIQSEEDFARLISVLTDSASAKKFGRSAMKKASTWTSSEVYKRKFHSLPHFKDLDALGDLVDPAARSRVDDLLKARLVHQARAGGMRNSTVQTMKNTNLRHLEENYPTMFQPAEAEGIAGLLAEHRPREYSLKLMPVVSQYTHTLAGTNAWTVKGGGDKAVRMVEQLRLEGKAGNNVAKWQADILENTYIPVAMGRGTFKNARRAQMWAQGTQELAVKLANSPGLKKVLGPGAHKFLTEGFESARGGLSLSGMERKIAGYFYLTTLGGNPGSALKNMLQVVLTTGPTVGYATAAKGMSEVARKSHKYFALRQGANKLSHDAALRKAFPEFAETGLVASPLTEEAISNTLANANELISIPSGVASVSEKVKRGMMYMFQRSEEVVRLSTFEAGMIHARRAKMPMQAAMEFSRKLVEKTQFLTGPQNTPRFLVEAPATVKQLTQFPLRMLEFATVTAFSLGSGAIDPKTGKQMNFLGANPGTFARMIAGSIIALELGETMNLNMGDALIGGAIPTFQPGGKVLAPIPVVPPTFQVLGAAAMGIGSGDFTELKRSTPLLVPGGTQLFRMMGLMPEGVPGAEAGKSVAKWMGRTHADYGQPAPDGRIAVFTGRGTLKGYYRPWELVKYGMGIKGGDMASEQELLEMMVKNRDNIRDDRRAYMDARFRNDAKGANQISMNFKQRFGFDLPVTEKDMKAMQMRRNMTRIEQVIRTMPPGPAREQMIQIVAHTLGTQGQAVLGVDPMILGENNAVRNASRSANVKKGRPRFNAATGLSPLDTVNPQTIGRQRGVNKQQPPF